MPPSRITIKDVAQACGVSTQTISRVLNNRVDVSPATREKILAVIEQMDYQPNAFARGMRQQSTTLGVILSGLQHKGISTTLKGITAEAENNGLNLILKELPRFETTDMKQLVQSLMAHQVMGIIYAAPEVGNNWESVQKTLPAHCPPMVFLKGNPSSAPITISIDNYQGAYLVTRHLIDQGYQNIGHISGPLDWFEAKERKRGWEQALLDAGRTLSENHSTQGFWGPASGQEAFESLYKAYPQMDAVFVANDQMALAVLNTAWRHGLSVPGTLGVAGFDGISESAFFIPPLTTAVQAFREIGNLAVRKLIQLQNPERAFPDPCADTVILMPELMVRESSQRINRIK